METKTKTDFAAQVAASEKAQAHAQEIKQTRVGGLGGSDASILHRIGLNGLSVLTGTDHKRLAIMTGKAQQDDWSGNAYTNAGHAFEDWADENMPLGECTVEREKCMSKNLAHNFKTFAHADFLTDEGAVIECKFVQGTTQACATKYAAQLQWYYLMGAKKVYLLHGVGTAEPFDVWETYVREIPRDENEIAILLNGVEILDKALADGWEPDVIEKVVVSETPEIVQDAFAKMAELKAKKKALDDEERNAKCVLLEYLEGFGLSGILASDGSKHQIIYTKPGVTKTLDTAKLLEDYPGIDLNRYYKTTKRAASITFK